MTLYEIDKGLLEIMESIDPETGEWVGDPEAWERLNLERDTKIENTACYIKDLTARINAFGEEIKTLQKRKKTLETKAEWLMSNLRQSLDGENFETARCAVRFKLNPEKVQYTDDSATLAWAKEYAPDCLKEVRPSLSAEAIKKRLRNGEMIPGAELVRETRMEVR